MYDLYHFARDVVVYGTLGLGLVGACMGIAIAEETLRELWGGRGRESNLLDTDIDSN